MQAMSLVLAAAGAPLQPVKILQVYSEPAMNEGFSSAAEELSVSQKNEELNVRVKKLEEALIAEEKPSFRFVISVGEPEIISKEMGQRFDAFERRFKEYDKGFTESRITTCLYWTFDAQKPREENNFYLVTLNEIISKTYIRSEDGVYHSKRRKRDVPTLKTTNSNLIRTDIPLTQADVATKEKLLGNWEGVLLSSTRIRFDD